MTQSSQTLAHSSKVEMPTYIKDLLVKMDFIGHVPPGKKICIRTRSYLDPELWSTRPIRWIYGEDANSTCTYIDRIITKLSEILSEFPLKQSKMRKTLTEKAKVFRQGLVNLIATYQENADAASKLRTNLDVLDIKIPENRHNQDLISTDDLDLKISDSEDSEDHQLEDYREDLE